MWLKVAALLLYLLVLFAVSRLLEMSVVLSWAVNLESAGLAFFSTALVHPVSLSVREIRKILDARGVGYVGLAEKRELTDLVESSGRLMASELDEVMADSEDQVVDGDIGEGGTPSPLPASQQVDASTTRFTCGTHFYEEVEDSKDSIWLVLVVPPDDYEHEHEDDDDEHAAYNPPLIDGNQWRRLVARVKPFGIRTGVLNCRLDRKLCKKKGWHGRRHQIVLALPKGTHPKDNVVLHSYKGRTAASAVSVFSWVRKRLSSRLAVVDTQKDLERFWLNFTDSDHVETKVRLLLTATTATALDEPPLVYSALSMKFTGRVAFGLVDRKILEQTLLDSLPSYADLRLHDRSTYVVVTPEGVGVYGDRPGEHLTYKSMELYFRTLQPEMNDVFTLSLIVTNILACLDFFAICSRRKLWRQLVHCTWTLIKYNAFLFSFWIAVFGLNHLNFMRVTSDFFLGVSRHLARSEYVGTLRHHYRFWRCCPTVALVSFLLICFVYGGVRKRWFQRSSNDGGDEGAVGAEHAANRSTSLFPNFTSYLFSRPRMNVVDAAAGDFEEGLSLWIERLATPNLWLYPLIPYDYIKDLPTWRYRAKTDETLNGSESSDDDGPTPLSDTINLANKSKANIGQRLLDWTMGKRVGLPRLSAKSVRCNRAPPADTKESAECAVCLEFYIHGVVLCGLPCGHNYHQKCIVGWLSRDHHNCPICRRPSYGRRSRRRNVLVE